MEIPTIADISRRDPQERYREWIAYLDAQRERSIS